MSALVPGDGEHPPETRDETAIWESGSSDSLVIVLKALFTWQRDVLKALFAWQRDGTRE